MVLWLRGFDQGAGRLSVRRLGELLGFHQRVLQHQYQHRNSYRPRKHTLWPGYRAGQCRLGQPDAGACEFPPGSAGGFAVTRLHSQKKVTAASRF